MYNRRMHLPRSLASFNRRVTNPIQRRWAGRIPFHAIIEHVGRRSGRIYRTPVLCFRATGRPEGFVFLVGYGVTSDWVRNVLAADGGTVVHLGRRQRVGRVRLVRAPEGRALLPLPLRLLTTVAGEGDVLAVDVLTS